jgi:hypothetical protein
MQSSRSSERMTSSIRKGAGMSSRGYRSCASARPPRCVAGGQAFDHAANRAVIMGGGPGAAGGGDPRG